MPKSVQLDLRPTSPATPRLNLYKEDGYLPTLDQSQEISWQSAGLGRGHRVFEDAAW